MSTESDVVVALARARLETRNKIDEILQSVESAHGPHARSALHCSLRLLESSFDILSALESAGATREAVEKIANHQSKVIAEAEISHLRVAVQLQYLGSSVEVRMSKFSELATFASTLAGVVTSSRAQEVRTLVQHMIQRDNGLST